MKAKRKIRWIILTIVIILAAAGGFYYWQSYVGEPYYVFINTSGKEKEDIDMDGNKRGLNYEYYLNAYNQDGKEKKVDFQTISGHPLRQGAYLKVKVNDKKGVLSFEEVQKNEVPKKALVQLNKN